MSARTHLYFDLLDAFTLPGCPVCRVSLRAVERYLDGFSFEQVNDISERARLRAARGFCNRHTWQWWEEQGDRLGAAIVYLDVLTTIGRQLEALSEAEPGGRFGPVASALGLSGTGRNDIDDLLPQAACPACEVQAEAVQRAVETLLAQLGDREFRASYVHSHGICVPHLARALQRRRDAAVANLLAIERARLAALRAELEEYLRKQRHEHRHEPRGPEQTAPRRAVISAVGEAGASWPTT